MRLRDSSGRSNPGANVYLEGAVPAGIVVPVYGSHLHKQATRVRHIPTVDAASPLSGTSRYQRERDEGITLSQDTKAALRVAAQARRRELHDAIGARSRLAFHAFGLDLIRDLPGRIVAAFWPIRSEPDLRPLLHALAASGKQVALPAIPGKDTALEFRAWQPEDVLGAGPLGTASPAPNRPVLRPEIVLVPMLAFDRGRHRLGYGGGYYDRTLAALRADGMPVTAIGVAYAGLELAAVPTDPWDERVDAILTEGGLIECRT